MLLSCSEIVLLHSIDNEIPVASVKSHFSKVNISLFNNNSKVVGSCGEDGLVNFYTQNLEYVSSINDPDVKDSSIVSLAFSNSSHYLTYSSNNGLLKIWEFSQERAKFSFDLEKNFVTSLCYNNNETFLASGTIGGDIILFNSSYSPSKFKISNLSPVNSIKCSPYLENVFVSGMKNGEIFFLDASERKLIQKFNNHSNSCTGMNFSPVNNLLFCSVGLDKNINFYDTTIKSHVKEIPTDSPLTSMSFNLDGKTIAVSNIKGEVLIYDLRYTSQPCKSLVGHKKSPVNHIEFAKKDRNHFKFNNKTLKNSNKDNEIPPINNMENNKMINDPNVFAESNLSDLKSNRENKMISKPLSDMSNLQRSNKLVKANDENNNETFMQKQSQVLTNQSIISEKPNTNIINNQQAFLKNQINVKTVDKKLTSSNILNGNDMHMSIDNEKQLSNSINNKLNNLDNQTNLFIKNTIEVEFFKLKQFVHEEIQGLHIELIRQFEIQQSELVSLIKNLSLVNNKTAIEIDKLQKENNNLKSQYF